MPNDPVVVVGGTVLAAGETGARPADIVLNGDCIAAIVAPGTADAPQRIDATGRLIIPGLIIILLALLLWPVAAGIRWHYGRKLELDSPEKRLRLTVRLVCILDVVFVLAWVIVISKANDPSAFSRSLDPLLYGIQIIGVLGAIGTLLVLFHALQSWSKPGRWVWSKIFDTLLALSCVAFTWFIWHWNLINFNLKY
jgi:hypothetical protein